MKYILVLTLIIAGVTYIFLAGPKVAGKTAYTDRREAVWDRIVELEHQRQTMLIVARGRMASYSHPDAGHHGRGTHGFRHFEGYASGPYGWEMLDSPMFFPLNLP